LGTCDKAKIAADRDIAEETDTHRDRYHQPAAVAASRLADVTPLVNNADQFQHVAFAIAGTDNARQMEVNYSARLPCRAFAPF
jgi:hypothetical protein